MKSSTAKTWMILLQVLGALPLVVYPAVLLASVMTFSGFANATIAPLGRILLSCFYGGTALYPLAPLTCSLLAWRAFRQGSHPVGVWLSAIPLGILVLFIGLFFAMAALEVNR